MATADIDPTAASSHRIARAFLILGRIGFWIQFVFLIAVTLLGIWTFSVVGSRAGLGNILAFLGLALPVFTTWWCWRYAQIGRALAESPSFRQPASLLRTAWVGVWAGALGVVVSVMSLFGTATTLLFVMLANPQVGIQISPATEGASVYTVSAVDALSIMSLMLTLTAELLVVAISLRLVFLVSRAPRPSDS